MAHSCHATGCSTHIYPSLFMCLTHWKMLPEWMRDDIWDTYRRGQEVDKRPSHAYCEAARTAIRHLAMLENKVPDVSVYDLLDPGV